MYIYITNYFDTLYYITYYSITLYFITRYFIPLHFITVTSPPLCFSSAGAVCSAKLCSMKGSSAWTASGWALSWILVTTDFYFAPYPGISRNKIKANFCLWITAPMREVSCVEYTPRAWNPHSLQSTYSTLCPEVLCKEIIRQSFL